MLSSSQKTSVPRDARRDLSIFWTVIAALGFGVFRVFPTTENLLISNEAGTVPLDDGGLNVDVQPNSADMFDASFSPDVSNPGMIRDMGIENRLAIVEKIKRVTETLVALGMDAMVFIFAMILFTVPNVLKFRVE